MAVTKNLGRQLADDGLLVPERIELHLALIDLGRELTFGDEACSRRRLELGAVMTLNRDGGRRHNITWPDDVPAGV